MVSAEGHLQEQSPAKEMDLGLKDASSFFDDPKLEFNPSGQGIIPRSCSSDNHTT